MMRETVLIDCMAHGEYDEWGNKTTESRPLTEEEIAEARIEVRELIQERAGQGVKVKFTDFEPGAGPQDPLNQRAGVTGEWEEQCK